jgi:hypothetical protein
MSIYLIYLIIKNNKEKFINTDKLFYNPQPEKSKNIQIIDNKKVEDQFLIEQDHAMNLTTYCPNTWIEYIDSSGNPHYNSRQKLTGIPDNIVDFQAKLGNQELSPYQGKVIQQKTQQGYDFNKYKLLHTDGSAKDLDGKTLKEIYDSSFVDYKKLQKNKKMNTDENMKKANCASFLTTFKPDDWTYENEKAENGGEIVDGLYAVDYSTLGNQALF